MSHTPNGDPIPNASPDGFATAAQAQRLLDEIDRITAAAPARPASASGSDAPEKIVNQCGLQFFRFPEGSRNHQDSTVINLGSVAIDDLDGVREGFSVELGLDGPTVTKQTYSSIVSGPTVSDWLGVIKDNDPSAFIEYATAAREKVEQANAAAAEERSLGLARAPASEVAALITRLELMDPAPSQPYYS